MPEDQVLKVVLVPPGTTITIPAGSYRWPNQSADDAGGDDDGRETNIAIRFARPS